MADGLERRRAEDARNYENRTRLAFADHSFNVSGAGIIEFPESARFELSFLKRPKVAFGVIMDMDELADQLDVDGTPPMPLITGYVTDWDQNDKGFYTGAWCGVNVYWTTPPPEDFEFEIDFTFSGIGIKDIDPEVRD